MKFFSALLTLLLVPSQVCAAEVAFNLLESVYASSPVDSGSDDVDVGNLSGRQAREYRERLIESYGEDSSDSSSSLLSEDSASGPVEVEQHEPEEKDVQVEHTTSSTKTSSSVSSSSSVRTYVPKTPEEQEEQDKLTLEQLEEYRDEAYANQEEQLELLEEGFSITSTSSLGAPLSSNQRSAILRRNVRTVPQLKLFARALAESDENLRKIEVSMDGIRISYRRKAWLFGFLPMNYILDLQVDGETVTAKQPWWHALARDGVKNDVAALQEELAAQNAPEPGEDSDLHNTLSGIKNALNLVTEFLQGHAEKSS